MLLSLGHIRLMYIERSTLKMCIENLQITLLRCIMMLLLVLPGSLWAYTGSLFSFMTIDHTPQDLSMGGHLAAYPDRLEGILENPTSLSPATYNPGLNRVGAYFASQPIFFNEFRNNVIFVRFPGWHFDGGAFFQLVSTDDIDIINDLGDKTGTAAYSFASGGLSLSKRIFAGRDHFLLAGTNLKGYTVRIGDYTGSGFATDIGLSYFFNLPRPQAMRYVSEIPSSTVSLVVKNLGTPVTLTNESESMPYSIDLGLRYGIYSFQAHRIDVYSGIEHNPQFEAFHAGGGLEYVLFDIVRFRAGYQSDVSTFSGVNSSGYSFGAGIVDQKSTLFSYRIDYTLLQSEIDGSNHVIGAGLSYRFKKEEPQVKRNPELDLEIVSEVQRIVRDMKQKRGIAPASLAEVYEEMRQRGYPKPELTAGSMVYLRELEQVLYIRDGEARDQFHMVRLKDGTVILGNIMKRNADEVVMLTSFGRISVPTEKIDRVESNNFKLVDKSIRFRVQYLSLQFKNDRGRFANSLSELRQYADQTGKFMPTTAQNILKYNPNTGEVRLTEEEITQPVDNGSGNPGETGEETEQPLEEETTDNDSTSLEDSQTPIIEEDTAPDGPDLDPLFQE